MATGKMFKKHVLYAMLMFFKTSHSKYVIKFGYSEDIMKRMISLAKSYGCEICLINIKLINGRHDETMFHDMLTKIYPYLIEQYSIKDKKKKELYKLSPVLLDHFDCFLSNESDIDKQIVLRRLDNEYMDKQIQLAKINGRNNFEGNYYAIRDTVDLYDENDICDLYVDPEDRSNNEINSYDDIDIINSYDDIDVDSEDGSNNEIDPHCEINKKTQCKNKDLVDKFIDKYCEISGKKRDKIHRPELFKKFKKYCTDNAITAKIFEEKLDKKNVKIIKSCESEYFFIGIKYVDED